MNTTKMLDKLKIGNGSAEDENNIADYFFETTTFQKVVFDEVDIIEGRQGAGKSTIYKMLLENEKFFRKKNPDTDENVLSNVSILKAVNVDGHPIIESFNKVPEDYNYKLAWKTYLFIVIGNWILKKYRMNRNSEDIKKLEEWLNKYGLLNFDLDEDRFLREAIEKLKSFKFEAFSIKGEYSSEKKVEKEKNISPDAGLEFINDWLVRQDFYVWVILDRLDDAFNHNSTQGYLALRGLILAYQDMKNFDQIKVKLFIRDDVIQAISVPNFPVIQKIRGKMSRITWREKDLFAMICNRIRFSQIFTDTDKKISNNVLFYKVFPVQMNKKTNTWDWIFKHLSDSNGFVSPRTLIQFTKYAIDFQRDSEYGENIDKEYLDGDSLLSIESIRESYEQISKYRYEDTLLAANSIYSNTIKNFMGSKSTHNFHSLNEIINSDTTDQLKDVINFLKEVGFLKESKNLYTISLLYRPALNITQGKAWE